MKMNLEYHFNNGEPLLKENHLEQAEEEGCQIVNFHKMTISPFNGGLRKDAYGNLYKFCDSWSDKICVKIKNGALAFYKRNKFGRFELHRENGKPAMIAQDEYWWLENNKFHRLNGPHYIVGVHKYDGIYKQNYKFPRGFYYFEYYGVNDSWHRLDGPAIIDDQGYHWFENHKFIKKELWQ